MARPKKNKFDCLPPEFLDAVKDMTKEQINERIATVSKGEVENQAAKANDAEYQEAKETAKELGAPYRECSAMNKAKIAFLCQKLKDMGAT